MDGSRNHVIEVLRFVAAAAIVVLHLPTLGWSGSWGVDMFFIISGFVMMLSTQTRHEKFLVKRIIRIVPIYWIMTFAVFLVALLMPSVLNNTSADPAHLMKSLFFVPFDKNGAGHFPVLFVGWTLNYEMFFYVIFAVALGINAKYKDVITALVLFGFVIALRPVAGFLPDVYGNLIILEFVLGLALFEIINQRRPGRLILYAVIYVLPLIFYDDAITNRAYRFGAPCFLAALVSLVVFRRVKFPKLMVTLGGASYALYLSHAYIIQFCDKVLKLFSNGTQANCMATAGVFIMTLIAAVLIYKTLEVPVTKWLRKKWV